MKNAKMVESIHERVGKLFASVETWERKKLPDGDTHDARILSGAGPGCTFVVSDCEITSQGFPAGARGHDGMATIDGTIIRLSRVFAREVFERALAYVEKNEYGPKPDGGA